MIEFTLNNQPAYFPEDYSEVSVYQMQKIRETRSQDGKSYRFSEIAELIDTLAVLTDEQRHAIYHSTQLKKLAESSPLTLMHDLLIADPDQLPLIDNINGNAFRSFEHTSLGDALEFYYRINGSIEDKLLLISRQIINENWKQNAKLRYLRKQPFQVIDGAIFYLITEFNEVSNKGSREELSIEDDYTAANKPSTKVKKIYDKLDWDLIVEHLPNFSLCKGMNEQEMKEIPFGQILDELVKIKYMNLANWYRHLEEKKRIENERAS